MINELFSGLDLSEKVKKALPRSERCLVVLRGFDVNSIEIINYDLLFFFDRTEVNEDRCDTKPIVLGSLEKLKTGNNFYVMYEDYVLAGDALSVLLDLNNYSTYIINNNLFNDDYIL